MEHSRILVFCNGGKPRYCIGSVGNINKLHKLSGEKEHVFGVETLRGLCQDLSALTIEERKEQYGLKDDRADVIAPAGETFLVVADALDSATIMAPNISLADSIADGLYRDYANS